MRLFDEYGDKQITLFGAVANSQTFGSLSYSKALALLALPEEEREEFVESHPVDDMSTRELEKKIKELQEEKDKAKAELKEAIESFEKLEKIYEEKIGKLENQHSESIDKYLEAEEKAKGLKEQLSNLENSAQGVDEEELKKRIEGEMESIKAAMRDLEKEKNDAQREAASIKIKLHDIEAEQTELIKKVEEEAAEKARAEEEETIQKLKREAEEATAKLREAERKAGLAGDANILRFRFLADQLQKDFHQTVGVISGFEDKDQRQKLKAALKTVLESLIEDLGVQA
jgi:chromosome segregation ATPase